MLNLDNKVNKWIFENKEIIINDLYKNGHSVLVEELKKDNYNNLNNLFLFDVMLNNREYFNNENEFIL